jgi:hypothetical protein
MRCALRELRDEDLAVLEKCGFRVVATERAFAEARSGEIEEFVLRLEESGSA